MTEAEFEDLVERVEALTPAQRQGFVMAVINDVIARERTREAKDGALQWIVDVMRRMGLVPDDG